MLLGELTSAVITVVLLVVISYLAYSIHEMGHVLLGSIGSYIKSGEVPSFTTSAWDECAGVSFIKCPQQTKWMGGGVLTGAFTFGGAFLVILTVSLVSASLYKHSKNRLFLVFPFLFAINELAGNVICGTDNLNGAPYAVCSSLPIREIAGFAMLAVAILVFFIVNSAVIARVNAKTVKKWFH